MKPSMLPLLLTFCSVEVLNYNSCIRATVYLSSSAASPPMNSYHLVLLISIFMVGHLTYRHANLSDVFHITIFIT